MKALRQVTGSYDIKEFYQYSTRVKNHHHKHGHDHGHDHGHGHGHKHKHGHHLLGNRIKPTTMTMTMSRLSSGILNNLNVQHLALGDENTDVADQVVIGDQQIDKCLGLGKSGSIICKGVHKKTRQDVAIKIIIKKTISTAVVEDLRNMIKILEFSQHMNIVRLEDHFETKHFMFLCLELHSTKTLFDFIQTYQEDFEETRI
jgi:serine/threonine protein kinase